MSCLKAFVIALQREIAREPPRLKIIEAAITNAITQPVRPIYQKVISGKNFTSNPAPFDHRKSFVFRPH